MSAKSAIAELSDFLTLSSKEEVKRVALDHITGLTATDESVELLLQFPKILESLVSLLEDNVEISKRAATALINISACEKGATTLTLTTRIIPIIMKSICDPDSLIADECCMLLANLSRPQITLNRLFHKVKKNNGFEELVTILTNDKYNNYKAGLHYLGPVLENLSHLKTVRDLILNEEKMIIQRLLSLIEYKESVVRRKGIIATIRNCCFDRESHEWLLGDDINILTRLLLPLAGNEDLGDDNDVLPLDLQYLPEDKERDEDPEIRCMLLEAITQLCTRRKNREFIRDQHTLVILRELHKSEKDTQVMVACENLADILVRTEEEIGEADLDEVEVPDHLQEQFTSGAKAYLDSLKSAV